MKRKKVIPAYQGVFAGTFLLGGLGAAAIVFVLSLADREPGDEGLYVATLAVLIACGLFLMGASAYFLFFGFPRAEYTVDSEGMTVYLRKKTYRLRWEECVEFGVARIMLNQASSIGIVYCTTKMTTPYERDHFLKCRKNDYAHTLYFQMSDWEDFQEFCDCLPE